MTSNGKSAISGTYSNLKIVQSRGVVQIVIEVPLEEAPAVTRALGWPSPGYERHVAVVLLQEPTHDEAEAVQ